MKARPTTTVSLKQSYCCVIIGIILVAVWCQYIDPVINPDGVKYVLAGATFLNGDFSSGLDAYKWPFYSLCIALVSYLSKLPVETAALVFNAVMRIIAGLAFVRLVRSFGGTRHHVMLAALVFVFYPGLNEVQSMIVRDFAYLGCFMWMVVFFIEQQQNPSKKRMFGFLILGLLATAYRIEGLVYLTGLIAVYLVWRIHNSSTKKYGLILIALAFPLFFYGMLQWIYDGNISHSWQIHTRMLELSKQDLDQYIASLQPGLWPSLLAYFSPIILWFKPLSNLFVNILDVLSIGYALILFWGWKYRPLIGVSADRDQSSMTLTVKAWKWVVVINVLVLIVFVLIKQIVTDRYPLSLGLLLMLFIPFCLTAIWEKVKARKALHRRTIVSFICALLFLNSAEGLDRISSKRHMKEAGAWILQQSGKYKKSKIYSNNRIVDYYLGKPKAEQDNYYSASTVNALVLTPRWELLDFLAISIERKNSPGFYRSMRFRIGKEPERVFENRKGDKVLVYDFRPEAEKKYQH